MSGVVCGCVWGAYNLYTIKARRASRGSTPGWRRSEKIYQNSSDPRIGMLNVPMPAALVFLTSPLLHGWMELAERYPTIHVRPSNSMMRDQERYIEQGCFGADCGLLLCWRNSSLLVKDRKAARLPAIMAEFAATCVRSPTSLDAWFCMTHVLTAVCSTCVLRMSFSTSFHRPSATSCIGTQVSIIHEAHVPRSPPREQPTSGG